MTGLGRYGYSHADERSKIALAHEQERILKIKQCVSVEAQLEAADFELLIWTGERKTLEKSYHSALWTKMDKARREVLTKQIIDDILDCEDIITELEAKVEYLNTQLDNLMNT